MTQLSRRHAIAGLGAVVATSATRSRSAKAAEPVTVWWTQGFYEAENKAVIDNLAAWEKASGTKVNLTIMNGPDLITKLIAGMQVGDVPDLVHSVTGDRFLVPRAAWDDQLVDVSDVIDSQKAEFHPTSLISSRFYNSKLKKHAFYTVPIKCSTLMEQVWRPLIEEAGFSDADMPKTHDAYFDFSRPSRTSSVPRASVSMAWVTRWRRRRPMPEPCSTISWWPTGARTSCCPAAN